MGGWTRGRGACMFDGTRAECGYFAGRLLPVQGGSVVAYVYGVLVVVVRFGAWIKANDTKWFGSTSNNSTVSSMLHSP